jgi:hypothetical protein
MQMPYTPHPLLVRKGPIEWGASQTYIAVCIHTEPSGATCGLYQNADYGVYGVGAYSIR